jgi:hypothetical protein
MQSNDIKCSTYGESTTLHLYLFFNSMIYDFTLKNLLIFADLTVVLIVDLAVAFFGS